MKLGSIIWLFVGTVLALIVASFFTEKVIPYLTFALVLEAIIGLSLWVKDTLKSKSNG